jgi:hypothetical protein
MDAGPTLTAALLDVCRALNGAGVSYCLVGGLAVSMLTTPRATADIDVVVLVDDAVRASLPGMLGPAFVIVQNKPVMDFERARIWRLILRHARRADELLVLDIILADRPVYTAALDDPLCIPVDAVPVRVARPECLLAIKEYAGRPQDLLDAAALRQVMAPRDTDC